MLKVGIKDDLCAERSTLEVDNMFRVFFENYPLSE